MLLNLLNNILRFTANREPRTANREPRTANREQSSLNFFNFSKDKLLFIRICLALLLQKFNVNLVKYFLSVFICFAKNKFEIVNPCHYEDEVRSNPIYVDCHDFLRSLAMTIKNNFAILNNNVASASACRWQAHCATQGVRQRRPFGKTPCYLTSITFDSLSEKIKNLRLVINFNFIQTRRIFK